MDINAIVNEHAPNWHIDDDVHDQNFAKAIRLAYGVYKEVTEVEKLKSYLESAQDDARTQGMTHSTVARCVILNELIKEKDPNYGK